MKVLIACEFSGIVRDAFKEAGHDAWSCDLLPTERPGNHHQGDLREVIWGDWDLVIGHPPCTYLCNSGVRWIYTPEKKIDTQRLWDVRVAADFFRLIWECPAKMVCVENPIPHKWANLPKYSQIIQPWQFGHGETKATCLWLKGLPELVPTNIVEGREGKVWRMAPGPNRAKDRSRTYEGIAKAMAEQWGIKEMKVA
jgi:hypothetical protein